MLTIQNLTSILLRPVTGLTRRVVATIEKIVQLFRARSGLVDRYTQEVERSFISHGEDHKIAVGAKLEVGSMEFAAGDGIRVGYSSQSTF